MALQSENPSYNNVFFALQGCVLNATSAPPARIQRVKTTVELINTLTSQRASQWTATVMNPSHLALSASRSLSKAPEALFVSHPSRKKQTCLQCYILHFLTGDGRWRQVIRRCASVADTGVTGVCNWGVKENGVYWEECYCAQDGCNSGSLAKVTLSLLILPIIASLLL